MKRIFFVIASTVILTAGTVALTAGTPASPAQQKPAGQQSGGQTPHHHPPVSAKGTSQSSRSSTPTSSSSPMPTGTFSDLSEKSSSGDFYDGFSKKITYDRMIPPYGLEVTFDKTVHIIFPAGISYIDLGSTNIIAGKATGSENVLRVKAAVRDFKTETNFSVITEDGSFYTFNVKYAKEPEKLSIEMKDFMHDGDVENRPNNAMEVYLTELGNENPRMVWMTNKLIYNADQRLIKHIGSKMFGIQFALKGIYVHQNFLYLHLEITNRTNVPFEIDFIRMKIVDKQVEKRTAIQETVIYPKRAFNNVTEVRGKSSERVVFTIDKITIPDDKELIVELFEKNGGRNQRFVITNADLNRARVIDELKIR